MSGESWFALSGVVLSCLALGVSFVGYQLQAKKAKSDDEKELADQIDAIHSLMAKLAPASPSGNPMATIANISSINAALQALLVRVATLIKGAKLHPDWYQNLVLAQTAIQIGDPSSAGPYATNAVELARRGGAHGWDPGTGSVAEMVSLRVRATFYYYRGLPGDDKCARTDFDDARTAVENNRQGQGPYVTSAQLIELYVRQTDFELGLGNTDQGIDLMAKACREWQRIHAPAARELTGQLLTTFADNTTISAARLLTDDFRQAWDELQREHGVTSASVPDLSGLHSVYPMKSLTPGPVTPANPDR